MTQKQRLFYFTLWNRVMVEKEWNKLSTKERDQERYKLHAEAGCPPSSKDFTNQHFNRFKNHCQALLASRPGSDPRQADRDDARRRLIWRIKDDASKASLAPAYIVECARDIHVLGTCWEDLDLPSLENLMHTIHNRATTKLGHDPRNVTAPRNAPTAARRRYPLAQYVPSHENEPF